jgi:lantibiotic modifying enzyme
LKHSGLRGAFLLFAKEINKLGSLPENQAKELIDFFEDLFLIPLLFDFYTSRTSKDNSFTDYILRLDSEKIKIKFPERQELYENFKSELETLLSSINDVTDRSNYKVLGDLHPNYTTKVLRNDKILYRTLSTDHVIFSEIATNLSKYRKFFPKISVSRTGIIERQFVEEKLSGDISLVKSYYYNLGFIIPLFIYLRSTDLYVDNMLARLPYPIFFDLECLFYANSSDSSLYSIYNTGILHSKTDGIATNDLSVLTGGLKPVMSLLKPVLFGEPTTPKIKWFVPSKRKLMNLPIIDGEAVNPKDYLRELHQGFQAGKNYVEQSQDTLQEIIGSRQKMSRIVLRPTRWYRLLLCKSMYLQNLEKYNGTLLDYWKEQLKATPLMLDNGYVDSSTPLVEYELACMRRNLTPIFYVSYADGIVFDAYGKEILKLMRSPSQIYKDYIDNFYTKTISTAFDALQDSLS